MNAHKREKHGYTIEHCELCDFKGKPQAVANKKIRFFQKCKFFGPGSIPGPQPDTVSHSN